MVVHVRHDQRIFPGAILGELAERSLRRFLGLHAAMGVLHAAHVGIHPAGMVQPEGVSLGAKLAEHAVHRHVQHRLGQGIAQTAVAVSDGDYARLAGYEGQAFHARFHLGQQRLHQTDGCQGVDIVYAAQARLVLAAGDAGIGDEHVQLFHLFRGAADGFVAAHVQGKHCQSVTVLTFQLVQPGPGGQELSGVHLPALPQEDLRQTVAHAPIRAGDEYGFHVVSASFRHQAMAPSNRRWNSGCIHTARVCPGVRAHRRPFPIRRV